MMHPAPRGALLAAGAVAGFTAGYLALVRPRLLRWGATVDEVAGTLPGGRVDSGQHPKRDHGGDHRCAPFARVALAGADGNGSRRLVQLGPSR